MGSVRVYIMLIEKMRALNEGREAGLTAYTRFVDCAFKEYREILGCTPSEKDFLCYIEDSYSEAIAELNLNINSIEKEIIELIDEMHDEYNYVSDSTLCCGNCSNSDDFGYCEFNIRTDVVGYCDLYE